MENEKDYTPEFFPACLGFGVISYPVRVRILEGLIRNSSNDYYTVRFRVLMSQEPPFSLRDHKNVQCLPNERSRVASSSQLFRKYIMTPLGGQIKIHRTHLKTADYIRLCALAAI